MYHVYSTMANPTRYIQYNKMQPGQPNTARRAVLVNGGTGVARKNLSTPLGVHTSVSDEDMEWLKDNLHFKEHIKKGYILVRKAEVHPEVVTPDMTLRQWTVDATGKAVKGDAFPVAPQDFKDDDKKETIKPVVNKKSKAA